MYAFKTVLLLKIHISSLLLSSNSTKSGKGESLEDEGFWKGRPGKENFNLTFSACINSTFYATLVTHLFSSLHHQVKPSQDCTKSEEYQQAWSIITIGPETSSFILSASCFLHFLLVYRLRSYMLLV